VRPGYFGHLRARLKLRLTKNGVVTQTLKLPLKCFTAEGDHGSSAEISGRNKERSLHFGRDDSEKQKLKATAKAKTKTKATPEG
jgi:hypothetical protein